MNVVEVFKDTRKKSNTLYADDTKLMKQNTSIYPNPDKLVYDDELEINKNMNMKIKVVSGGTVSTAYALKDDYNHVAMLNFADAKRPGGWVIEGAHTQEENMCRCTNLYETLIQSKCLDNYYNVNMKAGIPDAERHYVESYTDTMIYAEGVAIFKGDVQYTDIPKKFVDVITCPAPCGRTKGVEDIFLRRMQGIVKAAYVHDVTHLVLGAWGCGAFGQNPHAVANCFKQVLDKYPVFDEVVFAIRDCSLDRYNNTTSNYLIFKGIFE